MKFAVFIILISIIISDIGVGDRQILTAKRATVVIKYARRHRILRCCGQEKCPYLVPDYTITKTTISSSNLPTRNMKITSENENDVASDNDESTTHKEITSDMQMNLAKTTLIHKTITSTIGTNLTLDFYISQSSKTAETSTQSVLFTIISSNKYLTEGNTVKYTETTTSNSKVETANQITTVTSSTANATIMTSPISTVIETTTSNTITITVIASTSTSTTTISKITTIAQISCTTILTLAQSSTTILTLSQSSTTITSSTMNTSGQKSTTSDNEISTTSRTVTTTSSTGSTITALDQTSTTYSVITTSTEIITTTSSSSTSTTTKPTLKVSCVATCPSITCIKQTSYFHSDGITLINALSTYGTVREICSKTYLEVKSKTNRNTAVSKCCALGMKLLEIETIEEYNCLNVLINEGEYWIAGYATMSCPLPYRFAWCGTNSTMIDPEIPFYPNEPDNLLGSQSCMSVVFGPSEGISDIGCGGGFFGPSNMYICEN